MRYAVVIDNTPPKILDFKTVARSEEWKRNVLSNNAVKKFKTQFFKKRQTRFKNLYDRSGCDIG